MKFSFIFIFIATVSCNGQNAKQVSISENKQKTNLKNYDLPLVKLQDSLKFKKSNLKIVIIKSKYLLLLVSDTVIIKSYPVVFGFNPVDDKLREGDGCTPEGKFKIKAMYPHKSWSKFIWFDYPNKNSWLKHNEAIKKGKIPRDSDIGGDLGIHGVPKGSDEAIDQRDNWTLGCISLKNKDIDEIYCFAFVGMTVEIEK